ncbi:MAG: SurA N-terminal domain-containing protein [Gammaproteobacteria bacterium]|nr:SurA N-terminal domain-containing protein [Gammaproteobacteria bacterium]|tara:strand:+ start:10321 stop:12210 length:1890 start_codon:yes stop_codon:yes gene_type:complete
MLQNIRDNSQGVIAKVIIGLIVAVFALFGVESIIGGFITVPPIAEINGEEISEQQLQASTQSLLASIGGGQDLLDQGLVQQVALNQLIEEIVLRQSAENASMQISSDRVDRSILSAPEFQLNGVFDGDLAIRTMASQGYSVELYRAYLEQRMLMSQVASAYNRSNFVTEAELQKLAELSAQTRDFRYLSITLGTRTLGTAISDEEIQSYYDANQTEFQIDETIAVQYIMLDKNTITEEIVIDESQLREQYEEERASFEGSAEKRASHILFEVSGDVSEDDALALATAARQRLDDGEEFADLALELSSDTISGEDGGDIGYSDGTAFPPALEEALTVLELNEVSAPVVSEFGVHLVKLTEDAENVFQTFEEVSARLESELKSGEVELIYSERLEDLSNLAFESDNLETIAEELNLELLLSEPFSQIGGTGIFSNPALTAAGFSEEVLLENNNSDVVELNPSQAVVLRVEEYNEATIRPLDEVEPEIAVLIRTQMEREAVRALGDEILFVLGEGSDPADILLANELEWFEETAVSRASLGVNSEILNQVFAMGKPDSGSVERGAMNLANGTFAIVELAQVNPGEISSLADEERESMSIALVNEKGTNDLQAFILNLRENADIQQAELFTEF